MEKYNYREAIKNDIKTYIKDENILETYKGTNIEDDLYDMLWCEDNITGNGIYWYDTEEKCSEYLSHNFDLLYEAVACYFDDIKVPITHYKNRTLARYFDCTIRCYLLSECLHEVLKEYNKIFDL